MLHTNTVEAKTLDLIVRLSADEKLKDFILVGGTALSLQIGHRKSIDIDLFTNGSFDSKLIAGHLAAEYKAENLKSITNGIFGRASGVKVDILSHQYNWLQPAVKVEGIRMASLDDIGAMKIHAIIQSGSRLKDFVDVHALLEHRTMDQLLKAYLAKYPDGNMEIARISLLYHNDVDLQDRVKLLDRTLVWAQIAERLNQALRDPGRKFIGPEKIEEKIKRKIDPNAGHKRTRS